MRRVTLLLLLVSVLVLPGCMISTQEGERQHVNSPHPEEITFHFHTPFNLALLFGRSALVLLPLLWAIKTRTRGGSIVGLVVLAGVCTVAAGWSLKVGYDKAFAYRLEVGTERLHLRIPSQPELDVPWQQIVDLEVEGMVRDVRFGGSNAFWSTDWEDLTIGLADGATYDVDLRPLSIEQRGTFWRAIKRKAELVRDRGRS